MGLETQPPAWMREAIVHGEARVSLELRTVATRHSLGHWPGLAALALFLLHLALGGVFLRSPFR